MTIIGGTEATNATLLAGTVGIQMGSAMTDGFCTGSYIGGDKVLTAAHCAVEIERKQSASVVRFVRPDKTQASCKITKVIRNPAFSGSATDPATTWWEDIAVLKIECADPVLSQVQPFSLATAKKANWKDAVVAGFGTNSSEPGCGGYCAGPPPTFPKLMQFPKGDAYQFRDDSDFAKAYPDFVKSVKDGKLVCFEVSSDAAFFEGDSGGPSVAPSAAGLMQLGVHSVVLTDNDRNPVVNCDAAVAPLHDWILAQ